MDTPDIPLISSFFQLREHASRNHQLTKPAYRESYSLSSDGEVYLPAPVRVLVKNGKPLNAKGAAILRGQKV